MTKKNSNDGSVLDFLTFEDVTVEANILDIGLVMLTIIGASLLSIILILIDIFLTSTFVKNNLKDWHMRREYYFLEVLGKEIEANKIELMLKPSVIIASLYEILEVDRSTTMLELILCVPIVNGIEFGFVTHSEESKVTAQKSRKHPMRSTKKMQKMTNAHNKKTNI